jgi:antitoxin Phd
MPRKQRATRQSVPAKVQRTEATRQHLAKRDDKIGAPKQTTTEESIAQPHPRLAHSAIWKLEEAKAKFSEVVRRAHDQGPQYVTVRGKQAVAIIDAAELERLLPTDPTVIPLVQFLESLYVEGLDLTRDRDLGREAAL